MRNCSLSSLSTSDYSELDSLILKLMKKHADNKVGISLPSLRLDSFSWGGHGRNSKVKEETGLTFAPEAGTQRLRDVINKGITEQDLMKAVEKAFQLGWNNIKLYFMIGLPTETYEDLDGIVDLAHKVVHLYYQVPKEKKRKRFKKRYCQHFLFCTKLIYTFSVAASKKAFRFTGKTRLFKEKTAA